MDYESLLLNSKASALERAQVNEASMLKSLQADTMNRNMYLEQQRTPTATLVSQFGAEEVVVKKAGINFGILALGAVAAYFILVK